MAVVGCEQPHAMSSLFLSSARESLAIERTSEPISSGLFTMHPDTTAARSATARRQAASRVQVERVWAGSYRVRSVFVARRWSGLCCPPQACRRHSSYPCHTFNTKIHALKTVRVTALSSQTSPADIYTFKSNRRSEGCSRSAERGPGVANHKLREH